MAGLAGSHAAQAHRTAGTLHETKATAARPVSKYKVMREVGGLDLVTHGMPGLSPKEYGLRYGNGKSKRHKTNKIQRSHGYKVAARRAG